MLKCCRLFSHVHYTVEGIVYISDSLHGRMLSNFVSSRAEENDLEPPTYSFEAVETQGNYCNQFFVNSVCSNLCAIYLGWAVVLCRHHSTVLHLIRAMRKMCARILVA